jgi:hypothetical protein
MAGSYKPERFHPEKCMECICGIQNDRGGIWCVRLRKIPTPVEVRRCRKFCPLEILDGIKDG